MSSKISIASVIEANRLSSEVAFLALIDIEVVDPDTGVVATVLNLANNVDPVIFNGIEYTAAKFDITWSQESGTQAQVSLNVTDYTQTVQAYLEQYGGGIGFNVTLYIVNADALDSPPEVQEFFQIIGAVSVNYVHQFTLGAENVLRVTFPRRRQTRDFCQNRYKDAQTCKYAGPLATCDLTLKGPNGCVAHDNSLNFGAFPGINSNGYRYE